MVGTGHSIGLLRSISKGLYYFEDKLVLTAYKTSFTNNSGIFNFFFVSYKAAFEKEINGESNICRNTSSGFSLMLKSRVHVAPIDLPHSANLLYPHVLRYPKTAPIIKLSLLMSCFSLSPNVTMFPSLLP